MTTSYIYLYIFALNIVMTKYTKKNVISKKKYINLIYVVHVKHIRNELSKCD